MICRYPKKKLVVILRLSAPREHRKRPHATVHVLASLLLNGDWRRDQISHHCHRCCQDPSDAIEAARKWLPKLVLALRCKMFSRADWSEWQDALGLICFLSGLRGLFRICFIKAFAASAEDIAVGEDPLPEDATEGDRLRAELAKNVRHAVQFWDQKPGWQLQLLLDILSSERHLMHEILGLAAVKHEELRCQQIQEQGQFC